MANITDIVDSVIAKVNTHTTEIASKADTTYVDSEISAIPSSLSKVASNVLLSGNLALASSAVTKSNANITYTGNGSTQDIVTGISSVDFTVASNGSGYYHDRTAGDCIVKNDAGTIVESGSAVVNVSKVHIKSRGVISNHRICDGLRGIDASVSTNSSSSESAAGAGFMTSFNNNGVTVGTNDNDVNNSSYTYILHQTLYTHIKWGLTNQGKRYIEAYNPVTREGMIYYIGSGIVGHQIPHSQGVKLDCWTTKALSQAEGWLFQQDGNFGYLNLTNAFNGVNTLSQTVGTEAIQFDAVSTYTNTANGIYITYYKAKSETWTIVQYQGTGASGNFVETKDVNGVAKRPARVIAKRIDSVGNWVLTDNKRNEQSGTTNDGYLYLNLSNAEGVGSAITYSNNGFYYQDTGSDTNTSGGQYIALVEFDTNGDGGDSYFDLPTDDSVLNVTSGKLPYTDGRDATNGAYNVFTQSYTGSVDFSTCPDGIHYVALDSNNTPKFYDELPIFNSETGIMYDTNGTTPLTTPISFIDDKPYQVASGTPMDRLVDYPSIPKNVIESSYVDGDLEVSGEVRGKNQCTAWVNFDGTTTPPTIRDSYNVKDVVRTATGIYDVYFEEEMDNSNYAISSISSVTNSGFSATVTPQLHEGIASTTKFRIEYVIGNNGNDEARVDRAENSVQIFGGKN